MNERQPQGTGSPTDQPEPVKRLTFPLLSLSLVAAIASSTVVAVSLGPIRVPLDVTSGIIAHHLAPGLFDSVGTATENQIIWDLRFPRAILALVVGAGLSLVGAALQAVVRNPLADPYLLGVSGGAAFGAVAVLVLGSSAIGDAPLSVAAFVGSMVATVAVYMIAQRRGRVTPTRLILAGVAIAYLFQAGYSYLLISAPSPQGLQGVFFWLLGSLAMIRWNGLLIPTLVLLVGSLVLFAYARPLDALLTGDDTAVALGIDVQRLRIVLVVVISLLTGVMVAVSDAIAFVGLIVPHFVRLIVGSAHRKVLPLAFLVGALLMQVVDTVSRTVRAPLELPLSVVTATIGVPFFLWLLRSRSETEADR